LQGGSREFAVGKALELAAMVLSGDHSTRGDSATAKAAAGH
jgi:hypothetical protein